MSKLSANAIRGVRLSGKRVCRASVRNISAWLRYSPTFDLRSLVCDKTGGRDCRGGESRDWLKTKVFETAPFVIVGFREIDEGRLEALHVAEERDGRFYPAGQVRFGFAGCGLWGELGQRRAGPTTSSIVPITPFLSAEIMFFGRFKGNSIRDGVLLTIGASPPARAAVAGAWSCDSDDAVAAFEASRVIRRR